MGRKKKPDKVRNKILHFSIRQGEEFLEDYLKEMAAAEGISVSRYVTSLLLEDYEKHRQSNSSD